MSTNSNTDNAVELNDPATRRIEITIGVGQANEILKAFGVPMPDAADIDEIRLFVCASEHGH